MLWSKPRTGDAKSAKSQNSEIFGAVSVVVLPAHLQSYRYSIVFISLSVMTAGIPGILLVPNGFELGETDSRGGGEAVVVERFERGQVPPQNLWLMHIYMRCICGIPEEKTLGSEVGGIGQLSIIYS